MYWTAISDSNKQCNGHPNNVIVIGYHFNTMDDLVMRPIQYQALNAYIQTKPKFLLAAKAFLVPCINLKMKCLILEKYAHMSFVFN
jgi:hypothetical protein